MEVSQETKNQMSAVKALINVYDLLNIGTYQGSFSARLKEAQEFVKALHTQALKELENKEDFPALMESVATATTDAEPVQEAKVTKAKKRDKNG